MQKSYYWKTFGDIALEELRGWDDEISYLFAGNVCVAEEGDAEIGEVLLYGLSFA